MTDRRLAQVHTAITAGRVQVLSVDVFDTLLWRKVPEPTDAFLLLGDQLKAAGRLPAHISPVAFAELRRAAEKAARERRQAATGSREVVLADIYREIPAFVFAQGFDGVRAAEAEFALEQAAMVHDPAIAAVMALAKAHKARVILVSDTYFTAVQMGAFLATAGLAVNRDFDRLYVSCEAGRPKWRDLFDTVLKDMAVRPEDMLHIGDSLEADVWPCRARNITTAHYDKWSFAPRVRSREWPADLPARAVQLGGGDFGLTGLRSRLFHRPPSDLDPALAPYWSYGAATLAPVFAAFARWVVASCRDAGITKIHGLMREGRFLNRVVSETAAAVGVKLATEELWLSRRAVIRAALTPETPGFVPEVAMLSPGHSTADVLAAMGLTTVDLTNAGVASFDITAGDALVRLCRTIAATPHLLAKMMAVATEHRAHLLTALARQFDLQHTGPAVVMDLGYSATIQSVLQDLLVREGSSLRLAGLYLALNAKALENLRNGSDVRAYLDADGFGGAVGKLLSRVPFILEHACMCAEGSLSHFDKDGAPVLLPNQRDATQIRQMEAMQAGIVAGVGEVNRLLGDLETTPADDAALKTQIVAILEASHLYPTSQEAATIGAWKHEAKIDFTGAYRLADLTFDGPALEYRGWPALQDFNLDQVYWPAAAFTAADPFIADVYAAGTKDAYRAVHLTSGAALGRVTVCPDLGAGFDEARQGTIPITINSFGRADLRATIKAPGPDAYRSLRLTWPNARAVIGVDQITVTFTGETEKLVREIPLETMQWQKASVADVGTVRAEPDAVCIVAIGTPPAWPHGIDFVIRLRYLRLDPLFGAKS